MKNLKVKLHRLNNSYESEPSSSGSASSLSEHHDNTMSDDENMNLPYLLKPPSYQNEITVETTNPESPYNKCETKADRDLRYGLSDVSSPESLFEGFAESSYGKDIEVFCTTNSYKTKMMSSQDTKESSCLLDVQSQTSQQLMEPNFFGKAIREDLYTTDSSSTKLMSSQDTKESSCLVEVESQPSQPLVEQNFFGKAIREDLYTTDSSSTKLMSSQDTKESSSMDEVPSQPSQPLVEPIFFGKAIREDLYTTDSSSTKLMSSQDTKNSSCIVEVPPRPPAPLMEPDVYGKAITEICTTNSSSKKLMSSQDTKESSCTDEVLSPPPPPLMDPDVYGKAIPEVFCITNPSTTEMTSSQDTKESSCMDKVKSQPPPPLMEHNFYGKAMAEVFCTTNSSTTNSSTTNSSSSNSTSSNSSSSNSSTSNSSSTNSSTTKMTSSQNTKELSHMDDVPSPTKPAPPLMEPVFYGKTIKVVICTTNSSPTKLMSSQDTTEPSCMDEVQSPAPPPLIEAAKNGPSPGKLLFPNFYDVIVEENSCNAVDVVLSNERADSQSRSSNSKVACSGSSNSNVATSELSFNGKIKSMCNPDESNVKNSTPLHQPLTIAAQRLPHLLETTFNNSYVTESSFVLKKYTNEKSPDLFADDDDDEDVDCNNKSDNDIMIDNDHISDNHDNDDQKNYIQKGFQEKLDHNQVDYQNYSPVELKNDHENIDEENDYNEENNEHYNDHEYIDEESDHSEERNQDNKNDNQECIDEEIVCNEKHNDHNKNNNHENIDPEHYHIDENNEGIENDNQENIDEYDHNQENNAHIQNDYHENIDEENDLNEDKNDNHDYIKENDNADDQENYDHNNDDHENDYLIVGHKTDHNKEGDNYDDNDGNNYDHDVNNDANKTNDHEKEVHVNDHKMYHYENDKVNKQMVIIKNKDHENIDEIVDHNIDQHVYQHNVDLHADNNHIENCNDDMSIAEEMQMQSPPQCYTLDDVIEEVPEEQLQDELMTTNNSLNCPTESSFIDDQTMGANENPQISDNQSYLFRANCKRELELLQRTRSCLNGIPPPPTVTIPKIDLINAVLRRKNEILNFYHKDWQNHQSSTATVHGSSDSITASLLKPTHSLEETQAMGWRDILGVRQHGLSFNLSKASESNEYLSLSVIDRYIGAETASSYQLSPSSAKKRNLRLKMLTASPGNRLSHLAKRRAIFSSANLATTSLKSTSSLGTQILLDKKKPKHRRKVTPKRKTPGSKKKNVRKTPSSSARKRLYRCDSAKPGPSRETSKRALFQSPAKTTQPHKHCLPKPIIKPEIATRVEKSKRALFSPDKQSENSSHASYYNSYLGGDSSNSNHAYTNSYGFSSRNNSTQQLETLLQKRKRHRADDDDEDDAAVLAEAQSSKIFRGSMHSLTPRALQIKSESFCIGAGSSAQSRSHSSSYLMGGGGGGGGGGSGDVIEADLKAPRKGLQQGLSSSQILLANRNNGSFAATASATKLLRAQSESATMNSFSNSLTENQRKKLLWAVSQALQEKKITAKHESFKEFASVLARVVRRIFQEYYLKGNASNSETMLRLAKKYAYNVIAGKNVDDIYFHAKAQIDEHKRKSVSRLSGYIAPEEYENHKLLQQKLSQKSFHGSMQSLFGTENTIDCLSMSMSQASSVGLSTTLSSMGMTSQASTLEQLSQPEIMHNSGFSNSSQEQGIKLLIQPNPTLQKSSSKSNLCGLALRENVDCEQRRSAQKNFTGKDQRNVSPYSVGGGLVNRLGSAVKLQPNVMHDLLAATAAKAKRQISFDS